MTARAFEFNPLQRSSLPSLGGVLEPGPSERTAMLGMLVTRHLSVPENRIGRDLPLNRLGFNWLGLLHLVAAIDLELGVYVPPKTLVEGLTLAKLTALVAVGPADPSFISLRVFEPIQPAALAESANDPAKIRRGHHPVNHLPEMAVAA